MNRRVYARDDRNNITIARTSLLLSEETKIQIEIVLAR